MKISDFLSPNDVILDVGARDKTRLLLELSRRAATELGLEADEVAKQLAKREELGSTGVGNGVALPHARFTGLEAPFGLFARLLRAIEFDAVDDQPVDIVFLLVLPDTTNGGQLNALACAARLLRSPAVLSEVRSARDPTALFQAITKPGT